MIVSKKHIEIMNASGGVVNKYMSMCMWFYCTWCAYKYIKYFGGLLSTIQIM